MVNNDVIRSVRFILNIGSQQILDMIALSGLKLNLTQISDFMVDDTAPNYLPCDDLVMAHFLDGLIYSKRGKDESRPAMPFEFPISNNLVLKKLKVAFQLKEEDMHDILKRAEFPIGRAEMTAFLRKRNQDNYRECGDQVLRYFLKGLAMREHAFKPAQPK